MQLSKILVFLGVIVVLFFIYRFFFSGWDVVNTPPVNSTIVAFGDSLIEGVGSERGGGFVSMLSDQLGREVINHGVAGDTTAEGLLRIDDVLAENPGTVLLLLGGNDALRRVPRTTTQKNLKTIIETFQSERIFIVLLGVRGGILGDPFDDMYEELARTYGLAYVPDVLDGIFARAELTADPLHPNDRGYAIVAERVLEELSKYK